MARTSPKVSEKVKANAPSNRVDEPMRPSSKAPVRMSSFGGPTSAGAAVTEDDVMTLDSVFTCVRVLAESMASMPLDLMLSDVKKKSITKDVDNPIYDLFRWMPNPEMTAYEFWMWIMVEACIRNRGAAQIQRRINGEIMALYPLESSKLTAKRAPDDQRLIYTYKQPAEKDAKKAKPKEVLFEADEILSIQVLPYGGLTGYSITHLQRETFGGAKATTDYGNEFFANGGVLSGALEIPEELDEAAYLRLKSDWEAAHSGKGKRHKIAVLEQGAKFNPFALNHQESQLLETQKFRRSTVAGIFRVPAHLINDLEKATFSNIEHLDLGYVKHSLRPWMTNIEQRCRAALPEKGRKGRYFKYNTKDLLRGDLPTRYEAFSKAISAGFMTLNDARRAEDMDPVEGGDETLVNSTLVPLKACLDGSARAKPDTTPKK